MHIAEENSNDTNDNKFVIYIYNYSQETIHLKKGPLDGSIALVDTIKNIKLIHMKMKNRTFIILLRLLRKYFKHTITSKTRGFKS